MNKYGNGPDKRILIVFDSLVGILNGPTDFDGFKLLISSTISLGFTGNKEKLLLRGLHIYSSMEVLATGITMARFEPILAK